jgi:hypothetical protein
LNMMARLTYTLFIAFFLPILLFAQSGPSSRSLIQYDDVGDRALIALQVSESGGTIMVEWPGGLWVRWTGEAGDAFLPESTGVEHRLYASLDEWSAEVDAGSVYDLECGTDELIAPEGTQGMAESAAIGTSDLMIGHTVCALFFVNQVNGPSPWTNSEQQTIMNNVANNLAWWSEEALRFGVDATFEIKPYFFDDPVCAVSVDPTVVTSKSVWAGEIMSNLGYDRSGWSAAQMEYTNDLILEQESDWGFIAYIIRGASGYRSNAQIFGPSTTVYYAAARSGLTFAHEVGHIFGLLDEYEERAFGTHLTQRNGLANRNADYRNLINAPCIMKTSARSVGMCCYNGVHLHWAEDVEELEIFTEPEDAIFQVQYMNNHTGLVYQTRLHQGRTVLPLGRGQHVRLTGLDTIRVGGGLFTDPHWMESGNALLDLVKDSATSSVELRYDYWGPSQEHVAYWDVGTMIPSRKVVGLAGDGQDGLFILSNQGIGYYNGDSLRIYEKEIGTRPGGVAFLYRSGYQVLEVFHEKGTWLIAGADTDTRPVAFTLRDGEVVDLYEPGNNFREQGAYVGAVMAASGDVVAAFSEGGLHRFKPDGTLDFIGVGQGLPNSDVRVIQMDKDGNILLGYDGGRTGTGFSGLYQYDLSTGTVVPYPQVPLSVQTEAISGIKFFEEGQVMAVTTRAGFYENSGADWQFHPFGKFVFDLDLTEDGRWVAGTATGLMYQDRDGQWVSRDRNKDIFQDNFVRAVKVLPNGIILAGHLNYGLTALYIEQLNTSTGQRPQPDLDALLYPNPNADGLFYVQVDGLSGPARVRVSDLLGRERMVREVHFTEGEAVGIPFDLNPGIYPVIVEGALSGFLGMLVVE